MAFIGPMYRCNSCDLAVPAEYTGLSPEWDYPISWTESWQDDTHYCSKCSEPAPVMPRAELAQLRNDAAVVREGHWDEVVAERDKLLQENEQLAKDAFQQAHDNYHERLLRARKEVVQLKEENERLRANIANWERKELIQASCCYENETIAKKLQQEIDDFLTETGFASLEAAAKTDEILSDRVTALEAEISGVIHRWRSHDSGDDIIADLELVLEKK